MKKLKQRNHFRYAVVAFTCSIFAWQRSYLVGWVANHRSRHATLPPRSVAWRPKQRLRMRQQQNSRSLTRTSLSGQARAVYHYTGQPPAVLADKWNGFFPVSLRTIGRPAQGRDHLIESSLPRRASMISSIILTLVVSLIRRLVTHFGEKRLRDEL